MYNTAVHASFMPRSLAKVCCALALLVASGGSWLCAAAAAADAELPDLITAARENFTPVSDSQLAEAKTASASSARSLARYLRPQSANGKKWLTYLRWDAFQAELAADQPQFGPLVATYQQLNQNQTGLELKPFRALSAALQHYIDLAVMARQENQAETYGKQLDGLAKELDQYGQDPTASLASAIGRRLDLLAGLGQAPELVAAARDKFARPNALVTVSTGLLRDAAEEPIDRDDPVADVILGTRIRGQGHTTGTVALKTIPDDDKAVIEIETSGRVVSQNVGRNGPAVIRSTGYTDFAATQLIEFTATSFQALAPKVAATTRSNIHSVSKSGGGLGRRIVANVGTQQAHEKQGQANRIAARHAETRIGRRMTDEVDDRLEKAWSRFQDDYRLPLERRGELPQHLRFSSTDDELAFEATQANRSELAAPAAPPEAPADADLVMRLHESAVNNYTSAMLGGATLSETKPGEGTKADVKLPKAIKDAWKNRMDAKADQAADADFEPWSLTFRRDQPIKVDFADGKMQLTIHLAHLKSGDDVFDRWDVTGTYTPELVDGGVTLHRDGELVVLPTGFDPDKGQLSSRQAAVRRNLTKVLTERSDKGRGIPVTIRIDQLEPKDKLEHVGPLPVKEFVSADGWLTVAWNRK